MWLAFWVDREESGADGYKPKGSGDMEVCTLPDLLKFWSGLTVLDVNQLMNLNDRQDKTFTQIANHIEKNL